MKFSQCFLRFASFTALLALILLLPVGRLFSKSLLQFKDDGDNDDIRKQVSNDKENMFYYQYYYYSRRLSDAVHDNSKTSTETSSYMPGLLTVRTKHLYLSQGLASKLIAQSNKPVEYQNGSVSKIRFHKKPDGAAVFSVQDGPNAGGWIYVSNSEVEHGGGVGAITFNAKGEVLKYVMVLEDTKRNCSGGKTYWNTYISCEENKLQGQVYEVDPFQESKDFSFHHRTNKATLLGGSGGSYESFAYDSRDRLNPTFYVTNDHEKGGLVRFTPNKRVVQDAEKSGDYSKMLHTKGKLEYLVLRPNSSMDNASFGTFKWSTDRKTADINAKQFYRNAEGIDIRTGRLYFTTKKSKSLFILDLDDLTYTRTSTINGSFEGQPDQIVRILSDDPTKDMLYFCEEASSSNGVHARDTNGNFYTILNSRVKSETSGLAFSPDNRHMYISLQQTGLVLEVFRVDGLPFGGQSIDIKHK